MTQHISGPLVVITSAGGKPLIVTAERDQGLPCHVGDIARLKDTPEGWATAQLFAAAPEMLAALRLVEAQHGNGWAVPCISAVREAIARAATC